jgi:hypothetical protein
MKDKDVIRMTLQAPIVRRLFTITDKAGIRANEVIELLIEQYVNENEEV